MRMRPRRTVVILAKAPRIGRVKSRLARDLGRVGAWRFYRRECLALVARLAADRRWRVLLAVSPDDWSGSAIWPAGPRRIGQGQGDLGQRMRRALRAAGNDAAVLVGSDIPALGPGHVWRAFRALGRAQVVFGPAEDGGYWLVGCRHGAATPDMFAGVRWSGPMALSDTLANLPCHRRHALADLLWDVDTVADYRRLGAGRGGLSLPRR